MSPSSDWDEIKRLASDFQKIQLSSTLQKLSERNCIEVVALLIEKGLINVIFTNDGKEYLTPEHLHKEIEDELYVHGGRINLVELAKTLNVDLLQINGIAEKLCKDNDKVHFILGQLLNEQYIEHIATEINEKLSQKGEIAVADLTIQFDLPGEFLLNNVMEKYLGKIIIGRQDQNDSRIFFTQTYLLRCKAKIRGALTALTRPTSVASILRQIGIPERIFHSVFSELSGTGIVTSKQLGAQYIPHIYTKTQTDWVHSFYKQNGYLEYDSVSKLGVSDPKSFIKRQLSNETIIFLDKCCVGRRIIDQMESAVEECIATGGYLDVTTILPTSIIDEDIEKLLALVLNQKKQNVSILFDTTLITNQYLEELIKPCNDIATENARISVECGQYQKYIAEKQYITNRGGGANHDSIDVKSDRKDERRRRATGGKTGGGAQGRETKTKSTKKHYRGGDKGKHSDSDNDDDNNVVVHKSQTTIQLITINDIEKTILPTLQNEGLDYLSKNISQHFFPQLSKLASTTAQTLYEASLQNSTSNRRQTHTNLQDKLNNLIVDIRLYDKGLKLLSPDLQSQLVKYLLKTLGSDICNEIFMYVSTENNINLPGTTLTNEQRIKIMQECDQEYKQSLLALNKTLTGISIDDYLQATENAMQSCSMILKKIDKKKDRTIILCHKNGLLDQLTNCNDAALVLHLTVLIVFTIATQNMLHASGKHVSGIISYLQPVLNDTQWNLLRSYHDHVLKLLSTKLESDEAKQIGMELDEMMPSVRELARNYKKVGVTTTNE